MINSLGGHKLGGTESQGMSRAAQTVLARLMVSQIQHLPDLWLLAGDLRNVTMASACLPACLGESCSPTPTLMPDTLIPPCVPLVPFKLVSWWSWSSEGVHLCNSICGLFKGTYLGLQKFLPQLNPHWCCSQKYGYLSSWKWIFGLGGLVWGWDFSLPR
ncbi:hypothetical protein HJG60_010236 [Phyllostomus discolor]|uniref:Uncharacterized protein n=1 Tax=Phyllostomus discolor TaxID=89673 RepID=A0A834AWK9_9CHIR|nr:hypothetical protein HJG60_010236 [Phyllostomus discolor]